MFALKSLNRTMNASHASVADRRTIRRKKPQDMLCRYFAIAIIAAIYPTSAIAQGSMTCGVAVSQLQTYVAQVNAFANNEYLYGIPGRCGLNGYCRQGWLQQLNAWYVQQAALVNGWYGQIVAECSAKGSSGSRAGSGRRVRSKAATDDDPGELDEEAVKSIDVDDEDKTVRIKIPSTPAGYKR